MLTNKYDKDKIIKIALSAFSENYHSNFRACIYSCIFDARNNCFIISWERYDSDNLWIKFTVSLYLSGEFPTVHVEERKTNVTKINI